MPKRIPVKWKKAKMRVLHTKEGMKDIKHYNQSAYLPRCTNYSHRCYKNEWKGF